MSVTPLGLLCSLSPELNRLSNLLIQDSSYCSQLFMFFCCCCMVCFPVIAYSKFLLFMLLQQFLHNSFFSKTIKSLLNAWSHCKIEWMKIILSYSTPILSPCSYSFSNNLFIQNRYVLHHNQVCSCYYSAWSKATRPRSLWMSLNLSTG